MKILHFSKTLAVAFCCIALPVSVRAESIVEIDVETNITPTQALGLIITNRGTEQRPGLKFSQPRAGIVTVEVPVTSAEENNGAFVSALILGSESEIAVGTVKNAAEVQMRSSLYSLPACPPSKLPAGIDQQRGLLESLVNIRAAQRDLLQKRTEALLTDDLREKINRLEQGFGLARASEINARLPAAELNDRFTRLVDAIKNYRAQEQRKQEEARRPGSAPTATKKK